ncbi:endonuclease MutS2 [Desulfovirgula thermocuniculi]|uniref:endonuclease MutS2 n=1 Tax=Desulfovirgula thermocuniculi TaxID=348842 RepID=UPI000416CC89|nr:endonuclease MutS2 [Desulfovirgula thermocuniculi]
MDVRNLQRLEFDKVCEQLAGFASSELGREKALALRPATDAGVIRIWQSQTSQGREILRREPEFSWGGWKDVRPALQRARRGAMLDPLELFEIGQALAAFRRVREFFQKRQGRYPLLEKIAFNIGDFHELEKKISRTVLPGGEIADDASPALYQIRRKLERARQQVRERLEGIIRSPHYQRYLQEAIVTVREGRYVVPVKQEFRHQVPGLVHDQSASGATLFVEPLAVVEANNEIRRLQAAEKREVERLLTELSAMVARQGAELAASLEAMGELDFIMARARYADATDAVEPRLLEEPKLRLNHARHPLLGKGAVPISVHLGYRFDTLIITGPNTGGKTVALKTVGLLVAMAQSGLHIPAADGSELGIFAHVFADIGDEQSIENSLSTFSSHLTNIVHILNHAGPRSLVLLDEIGAGTDPTEGAALAQAILERLQELGAKTLATTHYSELKNFAHRRAGVENACVEFDAVTLRPTYRLLIGRPGQSNAFEIARRLGLPEELVERARGFLSPEQVQLADLLAQLERSRQEAERELLAARKAREEAAALRERYRLLGEQLAAKRQDILARAREEARRLVKEAQREAEEAVRELRERLAEESARAREEAIREVRERLAGMRRKLEEKPSSRPLEGEAPAAVSVGQAVYLPRFGQQGTVVAVAGPEEVTVQVGVVKLSVPVRELRLAAETQGGAGETGVARLLEEKARTVSPRLDLRGMRADEALQEVEKYLDEASLAGLSRVYLVHGKGTGALRSAIQQHLRSDRRVKSFRLGEHGEGGAGVTVVELA